MKNKVLMLGMIACSIVLTNCSPSTEKRVDQAANEIERDIKKEKEETAKDLRDLRDDINVKLDKISKKLEDAKGTSQTELESVKVILVDHRTKIQKAIDQIDQSADSTWDDAQQAAKNTYSEVKLGCEQIGERFDNALNLKDTDK